MARNHENWLKAFLDYAKYLEAPPRMYFWAGVSAIAGALRRRVWIDQFYFKWYPNFYIIFVAPPGIVSKSTTVDVSMSLLREVPDIKFGPEILTWQSLAEDMGNSQEQFEYDGKTYLMTPVTIEASELGTLFDPEDRQMVDFFVHLWDGKQGATRKSTKHSGKDEIINPWINIVGCTTPAWIAENVPEYMIGGGFTSRVVFIYADRKNRYVAYPGRHVPHGLDKVRQSLIEDLAHISKVLVGPYFIPEETFEWGSLWYESIFTQRPPHLSGDQFGGYIARKQTMAHKLAMVLAAAQSDEMVLKLEYLQDAVAMLEDLEKDMAEVFGRVGKKEGSIHADRLVKHVEAHNGLPYSDAYKFVHKYFPSLRDFEDVVAALCRTRALQMIKRDGVVWLIPFNPPPGG